MGLGRKVFTAGEVLAASEVQGYLMDQSIMVFADAAARTSGIPTPAVGMHTYLVDTGIVEVYTGSDFVSANSVGGTIAINQSSVINTLSTESGATYSVLSSNQGQTIRFTNAGTVTTTVGTATAFTAGQRLDVVADGVAGMLINAGSGVTFAGAGTAASSFLVNQYEAASILSLGSNEYRIIGNITAI